MTKKPAAAKEAEPPIFVFACRINLLKEMREDYQRSLEKEREAFPK